jgi:hypothetical protein
MKLYIMAHASNVNNGIETSVFFVKKDAQEAMQSEYESAVKEIFGDDSEGADINISENAASILAGSDYYYWTINEADDIKDAEPKDGTAPEDDEEFEAFLCAKNDELGNAAQDLICAVAGEEVEWDMSIIGNVLDAVKGELDHRCISHCDPYNLGTKDAGDVPCYRTGDCKKKMYGDCPFLKQGGKTDEK